MMSTHGQDCVCASRRRTLQGIAGLGAALLLPGRALAGGHANALVLTCMDYRLVDDATIYFTARGLKNKYDQVILAGASAGALGKLGAEWATTFWAHVETAIKLHDIHELIVADHRDCGAYKIVFGQEAIASREDETKLHLEQMRILDDQVKAKFPALKTSMVLMDLDGRVETLIGEAPRG